jgi:flagellum-specific peptidoglycan hydrolase FlgJ
MGEGNRMTKEKTKFLQEVAGYAQKYMRETGVPASLTIAQAILESNWGQSGLARNSKNLFGIKGQGDTYQTKEFVNGKWITVAANFRVYDTFEGSVRDHNQMLKRMKRYAAVIGERDYKKAADAIWRAGYATDPTYPIKLINLIEAYELTKYDDWEDDEMDKADANKLIALCSREWNNAKTSQEKVEWNRLANLLRELSGQIKK